MTIRQDGPIVSGTCANLETGVRSSPMTTEAVAAVLAQASRFVATLTDTYSTMIAPGEVGADGSGRATEDAILAEKTPRALLYGRVQSGKTVAMILTTALCLDNGFRIAIVLTTDNVALVRQTASRFKDLDGPRVFSGTKDGSSYEWEGQEEALRAAVPDDGLVLVCSKNGFNLPEVIRFLQQIDASNYPVLILDDEADAATPDTTLAARSADKPNAPPHASKINRLVVANDRPDEQGFSLGEELPHSLYVQVTATPFVLFLQRKSAELRPTTTFLLKPGEGYCGGETFFGGYDPEAAPDALPKTMALVGENEATAMRRSPPAGLARSIDFFMLAACAAAAQGWPSKGFKHLSHTSHKTDEHEIVANYIGSHLNDLRVELRQGGNALEARFRDAYSELARSVPDLAPLSEILKLTRSAMQNAEVFRVNSKSDAPEYGPRLNFLVGGNILGRGLTIDQLLVTYYVREAKTPQLDTVWQHARMFGYRRKYLDYMRVFLPPRLALRFREIHRAEEGLRQIVALDGEAEAILIRVPKSSRATRPNALDAGGISTVEAGRDQVIPHYLQIDSPAAAAVLSTLQGHGIPVGESDRNKRPRSIAFDDFAALVSQVAVSPDDPGLWDAETILALLSTYRPQFEAGAVVYVREVEGLPPPQGWFRGRLGGPEIALLRANSPDRPSLALLYYGDVAAPQGWYPTLVMPANSPSFVFSGE